MPRMERRTVVRWVIIGSVFALASLLLVLSLRPGDVPQIPPIAVADDVSRAVPGVQDGTAAAGSLAASESTGQDAKVAESQGPGSSAVPSLACASCGICSPNTENGSVICSQPSGNPYNDPTQCTWFAWEKAAEAGYHLPHWGNACAWDDGARACDGYTVSSSPSVGSLAVWEDCAAGADTCGHVAWVDGVSGNQFHVQEINWAGPHTRTVQSGISFIILSPSGGAPTP